MAHKAMMLIFSIFLAFALVACEQKSGMDNIVQAVEQQSSSFNFQIATIVNQVKTGMERTRIGFDQAVLLTKQKMYELMQKASAQIQGINFLKKSDSADYQVVPQVKEVANPTAPGRQIVESHEGIA